MLKYFAAAQALRLFSTTKSARALYRYLGNSLFSEIRVKKGLPKVYVERSKDHLSLLKEHEAISDGIRAMELGTGWVHWGAFFLRCFYDINVTAYDVWDNRQWRVFQKYVTGYKKEIDVISLELGLDVKRAESVIDCIVKCNIFDEIYDKLNINYHIDANGSLSAFKRNHFDLIYSSDVLEHVEETIVDKYISELWRILTPGGISFHQIEFADHLRIYDRSVNPKNYIQYSDFFWDNFLKNKVQYINRIQKTQWLNLFEKAGFELVDCITVGESDISELKLSKRFQDMTKEDLEATASIIIHKKPKRALVCTDTVLT